MSVEQRDTRDFEADGIRAENYESPSVIAKRLEANGDYMYVKGLNKKYGDFKAVDNLNVKMYDS